MGILLEKAISQVSELPEGEQEAIAKWLLEEMASERRWADLFAKHHTVLERMADEALKEHEQGRTIPLDPATMVE